MFTPLKRTSSTLICINENLYPPENGRNNNELKTVQINSKVTQIMTSTVNVDQIARFCSRLFLYETVQN